MYHPSTWQCFLHVKLLQNQMSTNKLPPQIGLCSVFLSHYKVIINCPLSKNLGVICQHVFFLCNPFTCYLVIKPLRIFTSTISLKSLSFFDIFKPPLSWSTTIMPHLGFITKLQIFIAMWSPSNCISQSF